MRRSAVLEMPSKVLMTGDQRADDSGLDDEAKPAHGRSLSLKKKATARFGISCSCLVIDPER